MFVNLTNISKMETMAALAEGYFNAKCPKYSDNNYERYVVVNSDTHKCSFQRGDYPIVFGEAMFKCVKKEGYTMVSIHAYLLDEDKPKRTVTNYDGRHITWNDGNSKDADTGFTGEYVRDIYEIDMYKVVRGRIINLDELLDAGFYIEAAVVDAYQALGDFAKLINSLQERAYPVYVRIPFCENCSYLFQYQFFSFIDDKKVCINYRFLGIISDNVTKEDIDKIGEENVDDERTVSKVAEFGHIHMKHTPFLLPWEIPYLSGALHEAEEMCDRILDIDDFEKYEIRTSVIMNRFSPKMVVRTNRGVFHVVYDRISDYALLYYSSDTSIPMERIEGYGGFLSAFEIIKKKLEELSQDE